MGPNEDKLLAKFRKAIVGAKIKSVSYMTEEERDSLGFNNRGVVIEFDNGAILYPMADDEGNNVGALSWDGKDEGGVVAVI